MRQTEHGASLSSRSPRKNRSRRRVHKGAVDIGALIDAMFKKRITINEGGVQKRISGFGAILQMMWIKEMNGDRQALAARRKYEAFAREQRPEQPREIIVKGGLPKRPLSA